MRSRSKTRDGFTRYRESVDGEEEGRLDERRMKGRGFFQVEGEGTRPNWHWADFSALTGLGWSRGVKNHHHVISHVIYWSHDYSASLVFTAHRIPPSTFTPTHPLLAGGSPGYGAHSLRLEWISRQDGADDIVFPRAICPFHPQT